MMRKRKTGSRAAIALAAALAMGATGAARAAGGCVTPPQAEAMMTFILPSVIESIRDQCAATLPENAYLRNASSEMVARYRPDAEAAWSKARDGFVQMIGEKDMAKASDKRLRTLVEASFGAVISAMVPTKDCGQVDQVIATLSPLPAGNMGRLVVLLMQLGQKDEPDPNFRICAPE